MARTTRDTRMDDTNRGRPQQPEQDPHMTRAPDYKAHFGRVQVAVWRRENEDRTSYSVSVTRSYKDKQDQWQRTTQLDEDDLLPAAKALDDAYTWVQRQRHQPRDASLRDLSAPPRAANS